MLMRDEEDTYRRGLAQTIDRMELKIDAIDKKVSYTNGKVRKLYLYLVLVAGLAIGMGVNNGSLLLKLLGV